ncbi:MAG: DNA internalization-related competence protein ComEC/Rec2 [Ferrimonas sp.]
MVNQVLLGWTLALATIVLWPVLLPVPILVGSSLLLCYSKTRWFVTGFLFGLYYGHFTAHQLSERLTIFVPGPLTVDAQLLSLPRGAALYQRHQWLVERINGKTLPIWSRRRIELSWSSPPKLEQGHHYQLEVVIRAPRSYLNLGGFNGYRHQLSQHLSASGVIKEGHWLHAGQTLSQWRLPLLEQLAQATKTYPQGDLIRALVLADKSAISNDRWQRMRQAGLVHLLAISGLHLSLVAAGTFALTNRVRRRYFPDLRGQGIRVVWLITASVTLAYGLLAGLALPTLRALLSVLLGLLLLSLQRQGRPWELLLRVASVVLLFLPMASLSAGFWLSFGAVSLILLWQWFWPMPMAGRDKLLWLCALQVLLTVVLGVLQWAWFGVWSWQGIWTNLLLVPYFSVIALPITLLAGVAVLVGFPDGLLWWANGALWPLIWAADLAAWLSQLPESPWLWQCFALTGLISILWLIRAQVSRSTLGLAVAILLFVFYGRRERTSDWQVDVFDVGQGLAVLIEHQQQWLLVDTGAAYGKFSYAQAVLWPQLQRRGIEQLDYLVLSHGDNDHAGGAEFLSRNLPILRRIGYQGMDCQRGPKQWGSLRLTWFQAPLKGNNGSCVVLLESDQHRVLLAGDMEAKAEQLWLQHTPDPKVDLLLAPHHGSSTSSTSEFVRATQPQWVVFAAGRHNRWGFPKADVVARYQAQQAQLFSTGDFGQLRFQFAADGDAKISSYRHHWAPWWYNRQ